MRSSIRSALRDRYPDLVRLAYLALDDGKAGPDAVLTAARRTVRRSARGTRPPGDPYVALRHRLAVELLTAPVARHGLRLRWIFLERVPAPPGPVRTMLHAMSRHERLVYLLSRAEGLTPPEVSAELNADLMVSAWDVDATLAAADTGTGLDAAEQRAELRAFDPTLMRLRPPPSLSPRWRAGLALTLAVTLLCGVAAYVELHDGRRSGDPLLVDAGRWRRDDVPSLQNWPTQGELRGDRALLRRAGKAWRSHRRGPPLGDIAVLFAGRVDGSTVVVLRDSPGFRDTPMIAQYFERRLSRGVEAIRTLDGDSGQLILLQSTWRYLVPPWLIDLEVALPEERSASWNALPVKNGVTDALPYWWFEPSCQAYLVIRMTLRPATRASPRAVTQLASNNAEAPGPLVWFRDPDPRRPDIALTESPAQWAAVHAMACRSGIALGGVGDLRIGHIWSGVLPDGGGRAMLTSIDDSSPTGTPGVALLIDPAGRPLSERGGTNGDYSSANDSLAASVWWHSPRKRRWTLIAAAAPGIARLKAMGELGTHEATGKPGSKFLLVDGPHSQGDIPQTTHLPAVQIVADEPDGDRSVIRPH
ncbi:hypothetical protein [Spirillospora sp. CA-294931]|uniref:hypothetical protein n=1 Tax=Spirillospora sp. CA-294931 TaxID=3240042 RepID=UPI003D91EA76